jgi:hypothetical protein
LTLAIYAQATGDADRSAATLIGARFRSPKGPATVIPLPGTPAGKDA